MLVTLVMLATCFGLLCGIGILFGIVGLLLKFGGKVLGACATILLPIGVIWLGFKSCSPSFRFCSNWSVQR